MIKLSTVKVDLILISLILLLSPLFFYKLGQSSLVSWDEAWYADISRHVLKTGDLFHLVFNGHPFVDQPPGGFWIEAISFKLFGISELSARLPSALLGVLSLMVIYLLGKKLFNRWVGLSSALALCSSFWFLNRARSGNLDSLLTCLFLLTLYLALLASQKRKFFLPFCLSLAYLFLIKSLLALAIIPALIIVFWQKRIYRLKDYFLAVFISLLLYGVWLVVQLVNDPALIHRHFFHSTRGASLENNFINSFRLFKTYLHSGIGKWFWPGILATLVSFTLINKRKFLMLLVLLFSYAIPFLFSQELHIWHLIPLHPILILLTFGVVDQIVVGKRPLLGVVVLLVAAYIAYFQIRTSWYQFIDIPSFVSDEAILSKEAGKYQGDILIDGDFDPAATFYADRPVTKLKDRNLNNLFKERDLFLLVTNTWRLTEDKINPSIYEVLKQDRDKVLVRKKN